MILRGIAALAGATALVALAVGPGSAATAQNTATRHPHRIATASQGRPQAPTPEKASQPATNTATNRITIVSVGPQAMAVRYRDLAMEETG